MNARSWLILPVLLSSIALAARWSTPPKTSEDFQVSGRYRFGSNYTITLRVQGSGPMRSLDIQQGEELVYHKTVRCHDLFLGDVRWENRPVAKDANSDGISDLIITEYLGDHACVTRVVQLGAHFQELDSFESESPPELSRDGQGRLLAKTRDQTWIGWRYGSASSPRPRIVLRLEGARFQLAPELMREKPDFELLLESANSDSPALLTQAMTRLLYTGHPDLCLQALRRSGLTKQQQTNFLHDFRERLGTSPWANELAQGALRK